MITILLSLLYIIYKPPPQLIRHIQTRWPDILFHTPISNTTQKIIALTIDDGPSRYTPEIQTILDQYNAKATFFIIGTHIPGREETLRNLVLSGHELGNHALHDEPSYALPPVELRRQIQCVEKQLGQIYASARPASGVDYENEHEHEKLIPPRYFRPGSGFFNASMRKLVADLKYRIVLGSVYPHDAHISSSKLNEWHILSMVSPGAIIVCHERKWTVPMLKAVLPELRRRGYHVVSVTEMLKATT